MLLGDEDVGDGEATCGPGKLGPRELYALIHIIFSDTNIQVYLHKKYYLSIR